MVRVTILMPVYNGESFLRETIDSVLCQTYDDFLFLIINDGSVDATESIILNYNDPRIIYHKNEKNLGLVATLNKGIEMVNTEFMARIDADDLWHKEKLQRQITLLDSRSDVGICGTSIHKFGSVSGDFIFPIDNEHLKVGFLFYCMMSHPSVVFRMSFLQEAGMRYSSDFYPAEDYRMWVDALRFTQIYNIPEILVFYRQHEGQITQETNIPQLKKTRKIRLELLKHIYPEPTKEEEIFYQKVFASLNYSSKDDYKKSKAFVEKIISENNKTKYVNTEVLKDELFRYLQVGYKKYIMKKYFPQNNMKNGVKYLFSFNWVYLDFRKNLKLLLNCLK